MKVALTLPDHVWGALAVKADALDVKVADLIADAVKGLLVVTPGSSPMVRATVERAQQPHTPPPPEERGIDEAMLTRLNGEGHTDAMVAHLMGTNYQKARYHRLRLHLPTNAHHGRPTKGTN